MKVAKGYKQTELGEIPEDWIVKPLSDCCKKITDGTHDTPKPIDDGIPFLTAIHIRENKIDFANCYYLPKAVHDIIYKRCNPEEGDVLMVNIGAGVATTAVVNVDYEFSLKNVALLKPDADKISGCYMNYYQSFAKPKIVTSLSTGGAQQFLSLRQIAEIRIAFPPTIEEQNVITNALSETDALVANLEKLILKKQNIKQGTMQVLLTGKKRLKGFKGEWEMKKLNQIGDTYGGLSGKVKHDFENGKYPYIPFMNIMSNPVIDRNYFDYVNLGSGERQNKAVKGDLFFNGSSETPEEVGMCSVLQNEIPDLYLNSFCFGFRLRGEQQNDGLFLSHYFRSNEGRKLFFSSAQGATRYNLSKSNFLNIEIPLPQPKEQTAIAEIISDMNKEITELQNQLSKYRAVKEGMMQNLLTGKVRLV